MNQLPPSRFFPHADTADEFGLVCVGGRLDPKWLLDAYGHGLFPWPLIDGIDEPQWWSPDPRAIFELDGFHVSRRLRQTIRSGRFEVSSDRNFAGVMQGCANSGDRTNHTWLTPEMMAAYQQLHEAGHAHSVETWRGGKLAGGVYGVTIGALFAAESMFHYARDASKVALFHLIEHLRSRRYRLFDIQQLTKHTASLGAIEISRSDYLDRLSGAIALACDFDQLRVTTKEHRDNA